MNEFQPHNKNKTNIYWFVRFVLIHFNWFYIYTNSYASFIFCFVVFHLVHIQVELYI